MTDCLALLRAVNLGGRNGVAMSDLRDLFTGLGFADPRTLLQSGNVVFGSAAPAAAGLERLLEAKAEERLGLRTDFFIRTATEWNELVARNPFPEAAEREPGRLVVMCLKDAPEAAAVRELQAAIKGRELLRAVGKQGYIVYPHGIGRSRLTTALIEKRLGTRGTGRNWNTVLKLGALVQSRS